MMVVDDSVVIRGLISRWIDAEPFGEPGDGRLRRTCLTALDLADVLLGEPVARELRLRQAGRDSERTDALAETSTGPGRRTRVGDGVEHDFFSQSAIRVRRAPLDRGCTGTAFE